jgi:predicted ATP-grasp superfamily ATP-dependent carboligase
MTARLRNPAVVLNPGTAGVGIIHALSLGGVDMITVGRRWPPLLGRFSRYPKLHLTYRPDRGETLAAALLAAADRFDGRGVLFPTIDVDLEAIILAQDRLAARYDVPAAPHIGMKIFAKSWHYELAQRTGVPIPSSTKFAGGTAPDVADFRFPLIVKPSARTEEAGGRAFRLRVLTDRAALDRCLEELSREHTGREFQLAENIPGEPDQLYTIGAYANREGRVLRTYGGRKRSQYPYTHGDASIAESLEIPDAVHRMAAALLEEARYHGISQVEFKYDVRDGRYKLLEINGRAWSWIKLPAYSGVNLPLIHYYDVTGDPRLAAALASPQRHDVFLVRDALIKLNQLDIEQRCLRELAQSKTRISAVFQKGEPRLNLAYRLAMAAQRWRGADGIG